MKAITVRRYGGPAVLALEEVPRPDPGPAEVRVRVRAAGVNPIDWLVREGYADEALDPSLPYVPGWDLSGVVDSVGSAVTSLSVGDPVFGLVCMPDPGETYAEYATAPAAHLVPTPATLSHTEAAALPMVALTAWRALVDVGTLDGDDRVLIHAAAGGVGHVAVQLAAHAGATVVGTASAGNHAFVRGLGADRVVDYRTRRFDEAVDDVDLVLDAVGEETLARSVDVLAEGGRIVTLPEPPADSIRERAARDRDGSVEWFSVAPDAETLARIADLVTEGHLQPTVSETFPLAAAARAQALSQDGHVRGKLVLDVSD